MSVGTPAGFAPPRERDTLRGEESRHGPNQRTRAAIGRGSAAKGANGEREVLSAFRDVMQNVEEALTLTGHTFVARSQFATRKRLERGTSSRDLGNIPLISIEVKRNENLNIPKAWEQAVRQADGGLLPVLVYRFNNRPWIVRTTAALIYPNGAACVYAVAEVSLPDFLNYFRIMYEQFLKGSLHEPD